MSDPFSPANVHAPAPHPASAEPGFEFSRRYATLLTASLGLVVLLCLAFMVPVPYVTLKPGPVFNTLGTFDGKQLIDVTGDVPTYPTDGTLDFTTVSVQNPEAELTLSEAIGAFLDPNVAVLPRDLIYPDNQSNAESEEQGAAQLSSSKDTSRAAALRAAGFTVPEAVSVASITPGGAAEGVLQAGDRVVQVDGAAVGAPQDVVTAISALSPGDRVTLTIDRDGSQRAETLTTKADAQDAKVARIGVALGTAYDFPVEIANNVGDSVGGPSAGTMFALAIYDVLTPGSLTGGERVAGTGEMSGDGTVGEIGGVRQKMAGASADNVKIFLVPAGNCAEAADGTDFGMKLVKITTLQSAIDSLEKLADNPQAKVPTCN